MIESTYSLFAGGVDDSPYASLTIRNPGFVPEAGTVVRLVDGRGRIARDIRATITEVRSVSSGFELLLETDAPRDDIVALVSGNGWTVHRP